MYILTTVKVTELLSSEIFGDLNSLNCCMLNIINVFGLYSFLCMLIISSLMFCVN